MTDIDNLKAIHKPKPEVHQFCVQCWEIWPCPIVRVVDELEAARKVVAAARAMSANENHAMHRACYICDETWLTLVEYDRVMEAQR